MFVLVSLWVWEVLWFQGEAASQTHSFRDAEPQPVIQPNANKTHENCSKQLIPGKIPACPPLTSIYIILHNIETLSVTTELVNLDLEMGQNIPC